MEKLINNPAPPLSHNIGYMLFTPYSHCNGILLCEATPWTLYVWGFYFLDTVAFSPSPDPSPKPLILVKLIQGRLVVPLTSRRLSRPLPSAVFNGVFFLPRVFLLSLLNSSNTFRSYDRHFDKRKPVASLRFEWKTMSLVFWKYGVLIRIGAIIIFEVVRR